MVRPLESEAKSLAQALRNLVEQFASTVLGVADLAAVLVHGKVARLGTPRELQDELSKAYLGGEPR